MHDWNAVEAELCPMPGVSTWPLVWLFDDAYQLHRDLGPSNVKPGGSWGEGGDIAGSGASRQNPDQRKVLEWTRKLETSNRRIGFET